MEKLIEVVRGYPVLYDTRHEDYMRTKLKDELWDKIAKELNYTDVKAVKEQWRKLRECHREAIRRQQKKSGQQATTIRAWTYQKQMEFLKPFMKNRTTVGYPSTSAPEESQFEVDDMGSDPPSVETHHDETNKSIESAPPKRLKQSTISDPVVRKYIEDSDKRATKRDELREKLLAQSQKEASLQNDALYQFFMSMYNISKGLPSKYQRQVRRKVFEAVSQAEDDAEYESQNLQMNLQFSSSSSTPTPTSGFVLTQQYPQFFSPQNTTSMSPTETNESSCSRQEENVFPTLSNL